MTIIDKQVTVTVHHCGETLAELGADIAHDDQGNIRTWSSPRGYVTIVNDIPGETHTGFADRIKVVIRCPSCGAHRQYRGERIEQFLIRLRDHYVETREHRTLKIDLAHLDAAIV